MNDNILNILRIVIIVLVVILLIRFAMRFVVPLLLVAGVAYGIMYYLNKGKDKDKGGNFFDKYLK